MSVIDLTDEPDSPPPARAHPSNTVPSRTSTRASRLPRFSRDVIDLEEEVEPFGVDSDTLRAFDDALGDVDNASALSTPSEDVEFLSEQSIRPPTPPVSGSLGQAWHARLPIPRISSDWNHSPLHTFRNLFQPNGQMSLDLDAEAQERVLHPVLNHRRQPAMRFGHGRGNEGISVNFDTSFQIPGNLDFETPAFPVHHHASTAPSLPVYERPPPPRSGFTRSAAEDDTIICPNCKEELGIGDSERKRQVWVVKKCGHVS